MNYYERHLGDYAKDTVHLTIMEHGAYSILLDRYYATEAGIPADQVHRLARARTKEEKSAVDAVLAEFFVLESGIWRSKRCDLDIDRFRESEPDRAAKRENEKERQRRSRERRKAIFDTLREHGIIPAYDAPMVELQTLLSRVTKQPVTQPVTRDATATQTPDTIPSIKTKGVQAATTGLDPAAAPHPPDPIQSRALELVAMLRQRGAAIAAGNPHARHWAEIGVTDAQALSALETAEQRRSETGSVQPVNAGLLNAIIDDALNPQRSRPAGRRSIHDERTETIAALTGRRNHEQHESGTVIDVTPTAVAGGMD